MSVNWSIKLPGALVADKLISPDTVTVPVNVGAADKTLFPVPVELVTPVPPLATGNVPVTPVESGSPVALVKVPDVGVPKAPPDVSKVADVGIVVELIVNPLTFDTVAPELIVVLPRVGAA